ncbi:hypothetical protein [Pseudolactococcus reticulitermitis]|uniref:Uncharacterized protein n=1 Tax=Pseudolactococcus reticulitermitis TaxID=2025039 RepID=A0A224XD78_9LACT|nr:hypothetical protein [Lactococcus reticulitermitis]GAX47561.1 hypothetical protein RsY01_1161 [Lactococcus reticulitermitis]
MDIAKIITICGSLKFIDAIQRQAERLEFEGNCVLSITYPTKAKDAYTEDELQLLGTLHKQKIALSDAIYVVNVDGYIGESTQSEIEYARAIGKEVLFLVDDY